MNPFSRTHEGCPASPTRLRWGWMGAVFGMAVFLLGAKPEWLGLDRSEVVGFVQIAVFLVGLAILCISGYIGMLSLWGTGERSIAFDIGFRLVSTGYVLAVFAGMADVFGLGTQGFPKVPFFGPWQAAGVEIGEGIIAIGFLMMLPCWGKAK